MLFLGEAAGCEGGVTELLLVGSELVYLKKEGKGVPHFFWITSDLQSLAGRALDAGGNSPAKINSKLYI